MMLEVIGLGHSSFPSHGEFRAIARGRQFLSERADKRTIGQREGMDSDMGTMAIYRRKSGVEDN